MSKAYLLAIAAVLVVAVGVFRAIPVKVPSPPEMTLSLAKAARPLQQIAGTSAPDATQDAKAAKPWPEVIAAAEQTLARSEARPYDTYHANYQLLLAHHATGNKAAERRALQGMIDSGFLTTEQSAALVRALVAMKSQGVGE